MWKSAAGSRALRPPHEEARAVEAEYIALLRECREREPENEGFRWQYVRAFVGVGNNRRRKRGFQFSRWILRSGVFDYTDRPRGWQQEYAAFAITDGLLWTCNMAAAGGFLGNMNHARELYHQLLKWWNSTFPDRPDRALLHACMLADQGEWERAKRSGAVDRIARCVPMAAEPVVVVEQFGLATNYWLEREIKHWESSSASANVPIKEFDDMMEASLATATTLYEAVGLRWTVTTSVATVLNEAFSRGAVYQRREGRIDDAIRTSERFMAVAQRLVRDFPMSPASYEVLSQAFLQRAPKTLAVRKIPR